MRRDEGKARQSQYYPVWKDSKNEYCRMIHCCQRADGLVTPHSSTRIDLTTASHTKHPTKSLCLGLCVAAWHQLSITDATANTAAAAILVCHTVVQF